jgi:hypothetical protein
MRKHQVPPWARGAVALGMTAVASAYGGDFSAGVGANYSSGKYGTATDTRIWSTALAARYETDDWTLRLSVPYLRVTGPENVIPGVGRVRASAPRRAPGMTTESGLGDIAASATYNAYYDAAAKRGLDLTGRVKFATADKDKGLGTGSTDESVQLDVYQTIGRLTLFADIGYTFFGHSHLVQLEDAVNAGAGLSAKLGGSDSIGASLDGRQVVTPGGAPQRELTAFWNHRMEHGMRLQAYVLKGFANGSPDWGCGASLLHTF